MTTIQSPNLSSREREVVRWLSEGDTVKGIAIRLGISAKTVEHHSLRARLKIGDMSIAALTRFAIRSGISSLLLAMVMGSQAATNMVGPGPDVRVVFPTEPVWVAQPRSQTVPIAVKDYPPVPRSYSAPVQKRGSEGLIKRKAKTNAKVVRAVPPGLAAPTWSINMPPAWRYQSGVGHLVTLEWNASVPSTNPGVVVAGYNLWERATNGYTNRFDAGTNLVLTVSGLASTNTYFFSVTAYGQDGTSSESSGEIAYVVPDQPLAMITILYGFSVDGPWYPFGAPFPTYILPPAYYKLGVASP